MGTNHCGTSYTVHGVVHNNHHRLVGKKRVQVIGDYIVNGLSLDT